ncbi:hypothetical protein AGR4A_Cc50163 [Agrobacterium tumefaciens str. B6]|uniref:Uncharacterized protein n=2 Tax=Agrobacterium tumefaciens TaxID=358 RepID=A0A822V334_AGRTU|nr:hypothetical protein AGR4B_Cc70139 [Agrobacterium tumefaciens str. CFBP 5621]CUX30924.1 hypothetical protein AGR4C_Cc50411 [Agrobacterium tumefaciens str. Kerr 14]CVI19152.1 hypothetical protein AGR4A_Cc50163 [Agrobacterium tumefaciens str. B6]
MTGRVRLPRTPSNAAFAALVHARISTLTRLNPETEKGRRSDPSMSLVLFTDPGLFLNVPKARCLTPRAAPSKTHPFHCLHQRPKSH